jgi:mono/diheme cytochrome c family protein
MEFSIQSIVGGIALSVMAVAPAFAQDQEQVARGKYLATAADCVACHTAPGGTPFAGGLPFKTPMGTIYAPNITADPKTGIGHWTDAQFLDALHNGIGAHGERLYPAFPYTAFTGISDGDALAIKAYLFSLPPVAQENHENEMRFPYNLRFLMGFWNILNFKNSGSQSVSQQADMARGSYLADALGHCAECHSPRNLTMGVESNKYLGGGAVDGWTAFNLSSSKSQGLGGWTTEELAQYLKTGNVAGKAQAAGPMAEVVENSTSHLSDDDLHALATFIKAVPQQVSDEPDRFSFAGHPADITNYRADGGQHASQGEQLFIAACATCHMTSGSGVADGAYPSLFHNSVTGAANADNLVMAVLHGVERRGTINDAAMPAFADEFDDSQIASLVNYVKDTFGNPQGKVAAAEVHRLRLNIIQPSPVDAFMKVAAGVGVVVLIVVVALFIWLRRRSTPTASPQTA